MCEKGNPPMIASNKTLLVVSLLLAGALSACSSLVSVDRTKIHDAMFDVPKPDAGTDDDAGE
jgi:hypothetical protein